MNKSVITLLVLIVFCGCSKEQGAVFKIISKERSRLVFRNDLRETEDLNILDYLYFYNGGGLAIGDINNDGLADIYVTANQGKNKLYLNSGDLKFVDISRKAGIEGHSDWNTGTSMADINGDGYLDIFVCAVVGINGFTGHNEVFINNGDNTFTERAAELGLDLDTYCSAMAFLDYDLDGDLDVYVLNHAVHTERSFGNASLRKERNYETGDRLMRNDGGTFTDVSEEAGIYGGINSYGLGIAIADFNKDGYPDIFIGNDFHEDDYYYLNQGDGTFKESLTDYFGHTSRFSMGNDVSDINHDGWPDMMSLDMLPQDEKILKTSEGDDNLQTLKLRTERYGYHYQFTRNMLYINQQNSNFMETALLSGVAATDWSWSTIIEDFNQDGEQDIFISAGIPKRPNDLDFIKFVSSDQVRDKINDTKLVDREALEKMPSGKVTNRVFEGLGQLNFIDRTGDWVLSDSLVSGATAFGDLDNDGDLDLVINNLNSELTLLQNTSNEINNYLNITFDYSENNLLGIGTKAISYHDGIKQYKELYTVRGFQSSSQPLIHFGYGKASQIDSLKIIWPDKTFQVILNPTINKQIAIRPENTQPYRYSSNKPKEEALFARIHGNHGIDYKHEEDNYLDFNRQKLIPYQYSTSGPAVAVGDLDGNGLEDVYFGSSKFKHARAYLQDSSGFHFKEYKPIYNDSINEEVAAVIEDFNGDGKQDIFVGTGGADFYGKAKPLQNTLYTATDSTFIADPIVGLYGNTSVVRAFDVDGDGDQDLFVGNSMVTGDFGQVPSSYILENEGGRFYRSDIVVNGTLGMVSDAIFSDFNGDGTKDLIVVGEWMAPRFFRSEANKFIEESPISEKLNGLWQAIQEFDIDGDGDNDYLLGNWGTNTKFRASYEHPLMMYFNDFDNDGQTETIVANAHDELYYPIASFDELSQQIVSLRRQFKDYKSFAGKSMESIFSEDVLKRSKQYKVHTLESGYLKNERGIFKFVPFNNSLQVSPLKAFLRYDFNNDGIDEVLVAGNFFGVTPYHGRLDSFAGALIYDNNKISNASKLGLQLNLKSARSLDILHTQSVQPQLLVTYNNEEAELYTLKKFNRK